MGNLFTEGVIANIIRQNAIEEAITRWKILKVGEKCLSTKSYHSFSLNDVAEDVGIRKASIFHYFDNKTDFIAEVLLNQKTKLEYLIRKLEKLSSDPIEQVNQFFCLLSLYCL